jgi:chloramphenicol O-acetyltransferase type A
MNRRLDLAIWERKDHFHFYKDFTEPFFGVTIELDCTIVYDLCKQQDISFFLYYLHKSLVTANSIEAFSYRIQDNEVIVYGTVKASATISRPNGSFGFSYIDYVPDYLAFGKKTGNRGCQK